MILYNLQHIDKFIFDLINQDTANVLFDKVLPFLTHADNWYLLYIALFAWLFWKGGKNGRIIGFALIITIILSDQLGAFLKDLLQRPRPCHSFSGDEIRLLVNCGGGKSFPSNHAINNFAAAVVLGYHFRKYYAIYLVIAATVAYSRVYVGVHYPFDVLGGALIGFGVGSAIVLCVKYVEKWTAGKKEKANDDHQL